jgi:hypothetical protein
VKTSLVAFVFALSCASLIVAQPVSKVAFTETRSAVRAFTPYGETTLPAVRVQLEIHTSAGKTEHGNLLVVYDPENGHYLWRNDILNYPGDTTSAFAEPDPGPQTIYAGSDELMTFAMLGDLSITEHPERAANLDDAERASIGDIERLALANNLYRFVAKAVPLYPAVGREFACVPFERALEDPTAVTCRFTAKSIVSVSHEGENWRLVVRNRWDQEIILDSKFNLVSTQRLPLSEQGISDGKAVIFCGLLFELGPPCGT